MIQLFRRILCPIDFSEHSSAALEVAIIVALQNDAELYLLNVAPVPAGAAGFQPRCRWIRTPTLRTTERKNSRRLREQAFRRRHSTKRSS